MNESEREWAEIVAYVRAYMAETEKEPYIIRPAVVNEIMRGAK